MTLSEKSILSTHPHGRVKTPVRGYCPLPRALLSSLCRFLTLTAGTGWRCGQRHQSCNKENTSCRADWMRMCCAPCSAGKTCEEHSISDLRYSRGESSVKRKRLHQPSTRHVSSRMDVEGTVSRAHITHPYEENVGHGPDAQFLEAEQFAQKLLSQGPLFYFIFIILNMRGRQNKVHRKITKE